MRGIAADLAHALREIVAPQLGSGRAHAGTSAGGDVTFAIDAEAEAFLEGWVAANAPGVAFYSEDRGMVGEGAWVLIVDPIDGTRPALAGLEAACTSVALAPLGDGEPTMGDVVEGAVVEIKSGEWFAAARGEGCRASKPIAPSANTDIERLFWVYGFTRRPARAVVEVIGELIDRSSLGGGVFDLGSATFNLTRILTGQLDAYVEPGARMVAEIPGMREEFARVGGGHIVNNSRRTTWRPPRCVSRRAERSSPTPRAGHSRPTGCSAPDRSSTSPAWRPVRPPSIGCLSRPWNGA